MQGLNCSKPACVKAVASAITKGTFTTRASVLASSVFPVITIKPNYKFSDSSIGLPATYNSKGNKGDKIKHWSVSSKILIGEKEKEHT